MEFAVVTGGLHVDHRVSEDATERHGFENALFYRRDVLPGDGPPHDLVDGLERMGMAERRPDPTDRRAKLVSITDAGEAGLEVANATRDRLLTQVFGALSEADRATFLRLLDSLDEAAQRLISPSATPDLLTAVSA